MTLLPYALMALIAAVVAGLLVGLLRRMTGMPQALIARIEDEGLTGPRGEG